MDVGHKDTDFEYNLRYDGKPVVALHVHNVSISPSSLYLLLIGFE